MIRQAVLDDLEQLALLNDQVHALHLEMFPGEFRQPSRAELKNWFRSCITDENTRLFVFHRKEEIRGYLILIFRTVPENPFKPARQYAYLDQICVNSANRRQGIARELMNAAVEAAGQKGITTIMLDVWSENTVAKQTFERLGFKTVLERMEYKSR